MFLEQVIFRCTKELTVLYYGHVGHVEHDIFTGIQLKIIIIKPLAMHDIY